MIEFKDILDLPVIGIPLCLVIWMASWVHVAACFCGALRSHSAWAQTLYRELRWLSAHVASPITIAWWMLSSRGWEIIAIPLGLLCWWMLWNDDDDDDRWRKRRRKAAAKVRQIGSRLVIVPTPSPAQRSCS